MPIYTYLCPNCGNKEEKIRKICHRDDHVVCEKCPEETTLEGSSVPKMYWMMDRMIDGGNFQLKGSGWSRDGYSEYVGDDPRWSPEKGYDGVPEDHI